MSNELTHREKQVILGTLLGDASIVLSSAKSARLEIKQSESQKSLTQWKYEELKRLVGTPPKIVPNRGYGKLICRFATLSSPSLLQIYKVTRPSGKKEVNTEWLKAINDPVALAAWYMDDGSQSVSSMSIHTEGFAKEEVETLTDWLQSVWKVECHPVFYKKYWKISFPAKGIGMIDPTTKEFQITTRELQYSWNRVLKEVKKCILVCCRCHREIHAGLIDELVIRGSVLVGHEGSAHNGLH